MAPVTLNLSLSQITEQLAAMAVKMESCMEIVCGYAKAAAEETQAQSPKIGEGESEGMREQIKANATILLPILIPGVTVSTKVSGQRTASLYVITGGEKGSFSSVVMLVYDQPPETTKLMFADKATTPVEALQNLLDFTMRLVQKHVFDKGRRDEGETIAITGGGYTTTNPKLSPLAATDGVFWGQLAEPSPTFSFHGSFQSSASSHDEERTHRGGNSLKPNGSFQNGNGSFHGTGLGLNGSFVNVKNAQVNGGFYGDRDGMDGGIGMDDRFDSNGNFHGGRGGANGGYGCNMKVNGWK